MGTILPYVGDLADIPKGWALCDGSNGTPDLTGQFLEGTTTKANIFVEAGLPNITGTWADAELSNDNDWGFSSGAFRRKWYSFRHDSGNGDGSGCSMLLVALLYTVILIQCSHQPILFITS